MTAPTRVVPQTAASTVASGGGSGTPGSAELEIVIPRQGSGKNGLHRRALGQSPLRRHTLYVSPSSASLTLTVNGGQAISYNLNANQNSPGDTCTSNANEIDCTLLVNAPAGNDTFAVSVFDGPNGTGNLLSQGSAQEAINAFPAPEIDITLNSEVASISVVVPQASPEPPCNVAPPVPQTVPISVVAKDADGNVITGPGSYLNPITLTDTDPSGSTTLSGGTLTVPGATDTLTYNGVLPTTQPSISASADNVNAHNVQNGLFDPQATTVYAFTLSPHPKSVQETVGQTAALPPPVNPNLPDPIIPAGSIICHVSYSINSFDMDTDEYDVLGSDGNVQFYTSFQTGQSPEQVVPNSPPERIAVYPLQNATLDTNWPGKFSTPQKVYPIIQCQNSKNATCTATDSETAQSGQSCGPVAGVDGTISDVIYNVIDEQGDFSYDWHQYLYLVSNKYGLVCLIQNQSYQPGGINPQFYSSQTLTGITGVTMGGRVFTIL